MDDIKETFLAKIEPLINKVGELTRFQRYAIYIGSIVFIVGIFFYVIYLPKSSEVGDLSEKYDKLVDEVEIVKRKANTLERKRKEMEEASVQFEITRKTLPETKDIPSLLANISRAGRDSGLEFLLFQPQNVIEKEFYAEIPVSINVSGGFHKLALFFDKVANLSRIVNIKDINIRNDIKEGLQTSCKAVTYRFIDAKQRTADTEKDNKKKKSKKKRR